MRWPIVGASNGGTNGGKMGGGGRKGDGGSDGGRRGEGGRDGGEGSGGDGEGGGGEGAGSVTTTVTSCATETSGLASTDAPIIADKLSNASLLAASAVVMRADASDEVLTISSCRITLAAITCSVA